LKIEITKGVETPVTKFFSTTPETDVAEYYIQGEGNYVRSDISRKLERERDEAREQNAKLREIAERAIDECWFWSDKAKNIQADWDKLNEEGAK
jgi:hypothetical protein